MRRQRTIYYNDARHYYLFVFEPPITLEEAWRPIDEVADTGVDTFVYGVDRGDGQFYPSRAGKMFKYGEHGDHGEFRQAAYWRVWHNLQSLIERGLDPLTVLIDRAHEKGMDFFTSMRLGSYGGIDVDHITANGGRGFAEPAMRDGLFAILAEQATEYDTQGVELDFAAPPAGSAALLRDEDVPEHTATITEWVARVSDMVRNRSQSGQIGARIYPTEVTNLSRGYDVNTWLEKGLVDWVVPMVYAATIVDCNQPLEWITETAHAADVSVYPMVQPDASQENDRRFVHRGHATATMMHAAAASYFDRGADGLYTWFLKWPLGDDERSLLTDFGDAKLLRKKNKQYVIARSQEYAERLGIQQLLPIEIAADDTGSPRAIPFYIADDVESLPRGSKVTLSIDITDLVAADQIEVTLNGHSLENETCHRVHGHYIVPYMSLVLNYELEHIRPRHGENTLAITLVERASDLKSPLIIETVDVSIEYS